MNLRQYIMQYHRKIARGRHQLLDFAGIVSKYLRFERVQGETVAVGYTLPNGLYNYFPGIVRDSYKCAGVRILGNSDNFQRKSYEKLHLFAGEIQVRYL